MERHRYNNLRLEQETSQVFHWSSRLGRLLSGIGWLEVESKRWDGCDLQMYFLGTGVQV